MVAVQRLAAFQTEQCSSHAAFLVGRAGQLPCCFSSGQCSFSCLFGATGTLAVPGGWTSPPLCELRTIFPTTYSVTGFSASTVFARLDRIVSRHILSGSRTSNSCSAALTCVFVLREEFAFLFQTFSRSDPPGKAPLTRGRYVFQKKGKKKEKKFVKVRNFPDFGFSLIFHCPWITEHLRFEKTSKIS